MVVDDDEAAPVYGNNCLFNVSLHSSMKNATSSALPNGVGNDDEDEEKDRVSPIMPMYAGGKFASSVPEAMASSVQPSSCT